jgi:hypothetical protein
VPLSRMLKPQVKPCDCHPFTTEARPVSWTKFKLRRAFCQVTLINLLHRRWMHPVSMLVSLITRTYFLAVNLLDPEPLQESFLSCSLMTGKVCVKSQPIFLRFTWVLCAINRTQVSVQVQRNRAVLTVANIMKETRIPLVDNS